MSHHVGARFWERESAAFELRVQRLTPGAVLPARSDDQSSGYDLTSREAVRIPAGQWGRVPTGLAIRIPSGSLGSIVPRAGSGSPAGTRVDRTLLFPASRGEVEGFVFNYGPKELLIGPGECFAQLIVERVELPPVREVDALD